MWTGGGEWVQAAVLTPGQVAAQIGLGVDAGLTLEPGEVGRHGQAPDLDGADDDTGDGRGRF